LLKEKESLSVLQDFIICVDTYFDLQEFAAAVVIGGSGIKVNRSLFFIGGAQKTRFPGFTPAVLLPTI
jgi:hypothetical protein